MIDTKYEIYDYLEFLEEKLDLYINYLIVKDYIPFIEFMYKDINKDLDILYKDQRVEVGELSQDSYKSIESLLEDFKWLYNNIKKEKYKYLIEE